MASHVRLQNEVRAERRKKRRKTVFFLVVVVLVAGLIWHFRLGYNDLDETIDNLPLAERGIIYDRSGKILALTLDSFSLYANARLIDRNLLMKRLAPVLGVPEEVLESALHQGDVQTLLARNLSQDIKGEIEQLHLKGLSFHHAKVRYYPQQERAGHVVGYVGSSSIGQGGVELFYNTLLNGVHHSSEMNPVVPVGLQATAAGKALFLTVDMGMQRDLQGIVQKLAQEKQGRGIYSAVLMNLENGAVLGNAQYPFLVPNNFVREGDIAKNVQNILGLPIAIPEKIRTILRDTALFQGETEDQAHILPWCVSPLTGTADFQAKQLGFQYKLWGQIGLKNEQNSDWFRQKDVLETGWSEKRTGEGFQNFGAVPGEATPWQIMQALGSILHGVKIIPHVMDTVLDDQGQAYRLGIPVKDRVVRKDVSTEVLQLFGTAVDNGTYTTRMIEADSLSFQEKEMLRKYEKVRLYCSVVATKNSKLLLLVLEKLPVFLPAVKGGENDENIHDAVDGKLVNMILQQEIYPSLVKDLHVQKTDEQKYLKIRVAGSEESTRNKSRGVVFHVMPDLRGNSLRRALRELNDLNLDIRITGTGTIVEQFPARDSVVQEGDICKLVLQSN